VSTLFGGLLGPTRQVAKRQYSGFCQDPEFLSQETPLRRRKSTIISTIVVDVFPGPI
jgi:hypothetical protein